MSDVIVGVDIGTSKVSTVIGKTNNTGEVEILGKGIESCSGIKKGIIVDIDATSNSIQSSVRKAEAQAELKVGSAYVNISGLHVDIINHKTYTNIVSDSREISRHDVEKLLYAAGTISIPDDSEIIDVVPRQFIVDGYDWNLTSNILSQINDTSAASGLITAFPNKTTDLLMDNPVLDLFDYYMVPINKLAYMMDIPSFLPKERQEFKVKIEKLDKKIIATRILAAGILKPAEAFDFLNTLDYVDLVTFGVASKKEVVEDVTILKNI